MLSLDHEIGAVRFLLGLFVARVQRTFVFRIKFSSRDSELYTNTYETPLRQAKTSFALEIRKVDALKSVEVINCEKFET